MMASVEGACRQPLPDAKHASKGGIYKTQRLCGQAKITNSQE
jgi:hypothetical protein